MRIQRSFMAPGLYNYQDLATLLMIVEYESVIQIMFDILWSSHPDKRNKIRNRCFARTGFIPV